MLLNKGLIREISLAAGAERLQEEDGDQKVTSLASTAAGKCLSLFFGLFYASAIELLWSTATLQVSRKVNEYAVVQC